MLFSAKRIMMLMVLVTVEEAKVMKILILLFLALLALSPMLRTPSASTSSVNRYDLPVRIRRRLFRVPHRGDWELSVDPTFNFRLVVDTVEADNPL